MKFCTDNHHMTEADKEQQLQNWFAEMYNLLMFLKVFCIGSPLFFNITN
jgi:hypothetical protein